MSIIVAVDGPSETLTSSLAELQSVTTAVRTEILIASRLPWPTPPRGVRVIQSASHSAGDRLDRAARVASGRCLAFTQEPVQMRAGWQENAIRLLSDPDVVAVGGPVLPLPVSRAERVTSMMMRSRFGVGPGRFMSQALSPRPVKELSSANLVVKADAFHAVGGFQSPTPGGESARLCYKLRKLLRKAVLYHPDLAVYSSLPAFPNAYLAVVKALGRDRGDMARRLPETTPPIPYAVPLAASCLTLLLLATTPFSAVSRALLALMVAAWLLEAVLLLPGTGDVAAWFLAALALPSPPFIYALGFARGYLGSSLGEISPRRDIARPTRVLIFNWRDITHPWAGGAEAYMHQIGRRLAQAGYEVGWLCGRHGSAPRVETIDGIRFHRVGGRYTLYPVAALTYLLRLRKRYDVLIDCENGVPFFTPLYTRKPVILIVHHVHQEVFRRELPWWLRWLPLWLEASLMPCVYRSRRVVAVSESTRDALVEQGFERNQIDIVHNGVDLPVEGAATRKSRAPALLYNGRLKPYKTVDVLIRSMPGILRERPDARLDIVGQGPDRSRLERLTWELGLASSVHFHGWLPGRDRDRISGRAWVSVCPSAFEGWGIACMEASARRLPVVASRVPGLRDSVLDGTTGVLVPYGDVQTLTGELLALLADQQRRQNMGEAGRRWAAEHTWDGSAVLLARIIDASLVQQEVSILIDESPTEEVGIAI